jgi:hypothetical protein
MSKRPPASTAPGKPSKSFKMIHKTVDLLKQNERPRSLGKGKEKEELGDVAGLVAGMSGCFWWLGQLHRCRALCMLGDA